MVRLIGNKAQTQILAAVSLYMYTSNQISQDHVILTLDQGKREDQMKDLSVGFFFFIKGDDVYHGHRHPELIQLLSPMPPNISGIYKSSFVEEKVKLMVEQYYFIWTICLNNRQKRTDPSSLNSYCAIIWENSSSSSGPFLVENAMGSTREWAESFSSITITEN